MAAYCPGCKAHRITFADRLALTNRFYRPWRCPSCHQTYVNAPWATISSGLLAVVFIFACVFLTGEFVAKEDRLVVCIGLGVLAMPIMLIVIRPIPYATFRLHGERSVFKNILLFGLLPLTLVVIALYLLFHFRVGL